MKKIIASVLAAAMAAGISGSAFAEESYASLLYNNIDISGETEESAPFISNDRTMLPFRYLLDQIGANVDYDEANRMVKADRDGVNIQFSLDDTYIDITKEGKTERVQQDAANVIKNDRVFVPVRFISEAFDLNVGWDPAARTAIIVDMPQYASELLENSPKLKQYMEIASELPDNYTETISMTFDMKVDSSYDDDDINLSFGIEGDLSLNGGAVQSDITAELDTNMIQKMADINLSSIKDVKFTFMYNDGQFYAKTNLIDKLKEIAPDNELLNNASFVVNADTWFKADIKELFEKLGLPVEMIDLIKTGLGGNKADNYLEQAMNIVPVEVTSVAEAQMIDAMFGMYANMFENMITITDKENGNYDVAISLTKDNFIDMIEKLVRSQSDSMEVSEDEINAGMEMIKNAFEFEMTGSTKIEKNIATASAAALKMAINMGEDSVSLNMNIESALTPDTNKEIVMPEDALNLIDILNLFM